MKQKLVGSFNGGGLRGVAQAAFLAQLETKTGPLYNIFDLVIGTSTGGLVALAIANGIPMSQLVEFYVEKGPKIFDPGARRFWNVKGLFAPKYSNKALYAAIDEVFGWAELEHVKCPCIVTARDLLLGYDLFIKSSQSYWDSVAAAAKATTAAPTYFDSYRGFADGGLFANCPADCGIIELISQGVSPADIKCLSLGTGPTDSKWPKNNGLLGWGPEIVDTLMYSGMDAAVHRAKTMLGGEERFLHIETITNAWYKMDDVAHIDEMHKAGLAAWKASGDKGFGVDYARSHSEVD